MNVSIKNIKMYQELNKFKLYPFKRTSPRTAE